MKYPYALKLYGISEKENAKKAISEGFLTSGKWCKLFEEKLKNFLKVKHVILTNSGSSANLLAFQACIRKYAGNFKKIITTALCFPTTISPAVQAGYELFFVDVDSTLNIDTKALIQNIDSRTGGVVIAHTLGNPAQCREIAEICKEKQIFFIEDCCDALGAKSEGDHVGTFGDCGTLSFYPAHHITTGEGGAVFTNNDELAEILRSLNEWGRECSCSSGHDNKCGQRFTQKSGQMPEGYDHKYIYNFFGFNLKMTEIQAAIGCAQMDRLPDILEYRKISHNILIDRIKNLSKVFMFSVNPQAEPSWFCLPLAHRKRKEIVQKLEEAGIQTRPFFAGDIRKQPIENFDHSSDGILRTTQEFLDCGFFIGLRGCYDSELQKAEAALYTILKSFE